MNTSLVSICECYFLARPASITSWYKAKRGAFCLSSQVVCNSSSAGSTRHNVGCCLDEKSSCMSFKFFSISLASATRSQNPIPLCEGKRRPWNFPFYTAIMMDRCNGIIQCVGWLYEYSIVSKSFMLLFFMTSTSGISPQCCSSRSLSCKYITHKCFVLNNAIQCLPVGRCQNLHCHCCHHQPVQFLSLSLQPRPLHCHLYCRYWLQHSSPFFLARVPLPAFPCHFDQMLLFLGMESPFGFRLTTGFPLLGLLAHLWFVG